MDENNHIIEKHLNHNIKKEQKPKKKTESQLFQMSIDKNSKNNKNPKK